MDATPKCRVLLIHPGTQYSGRLAIEFSRKNLLSKFYTGFAFCAGGFLDAVWKILPDRYRRRLANRRVSGLHPRSLRCLPFGELIALLRLRFGDESQEVFYCRNAAFQRRIPDSTIKGADVVVGFDTSSWVIMRRCRDFGIPFVLDQSIGHPDSKITVFEEVKTKFPDWSEDIRPRLAKVRRAEQEEHDHADLIIAASSFTRQTLIEHCVPEDKIRVNPYGVDSTRFSPALAKQTRPFRFIFVGAISARKGVPLLLKAWRQLGARDAELWLVGSASHQATSLIPDIRGLRYLGPLPHVELPNILQQCDVLLFPSYFEGFGLVILEAMACGLPVIATTATAAPDIYCHGNEGWIISPGDLTQLVSAMNECLENSGGVRAKGMAARNIAERFSWTNYGMRWMQILGGVCH